MLLVPGAQRSTKFADKICRQAWQAEGCSRYVPLVKHALNSVQNPRPGRSESRQNSGVNLKDSR